ncbi:MAG: iron-containing alcohol dehydrogenase [Anaerolineae bacterium]|nr:iron-containing alcohol dehydrogenase [Anaerolineae bacterium]
MRIVTLQQPGRIAFGPHCADGVGPDLRRWGCSRVYLVTSPPVLPHAERVAAALADEGIAAEVFSEVLTEPDLEMLEEVRIRARAFGPDGVVGVGGGSALDLAKLVAALVDADGEAREFLGTDRIPARRSRLVCLPTTSGTGSEVSPNAILLDRADQLKKAAISPYLMPDAAYVDPLLTLSVPPSVTAATGLDALTHCIEAYANRFAHPAVDVYALKGIELTGSNLARAVANGGDVEAREGMSLASLFGGLCLGPVGTGAVHALAYPLGGEFHVAHGLSNALLLPHVLEHNLPAMPERYADVALALGAERAGTPEETARRGLTRLRDLYRECGLDTSLSELGVPESAIPRMARSAMEVTRLLKNNPREVTIADAEAIYRAAY